MTKDNSIKFHQEKIMIPNPHGEGFILEVKPKNAEGVLSPYVHYESPASRRFVGYDMICKDLEFVKSALFLYFQLPNETPPAIFRSIWVAATVTYAKCFTSASEGRGINLHADSMFRDNATARITHDEIMDIRHAYLAHSGAGKREGGRTYVTLRSDPTNKAVIKLDVGIFALRLPEKKHLDSFQVVINFLIPKVNEALAVARKRLEDEVHAIPLDALYAAALQP